MKIITISTEIKFYMNFLIESIKRNGNELIILGLGQKWLGFNWRNKLILDYIKTLNKDEVVVVIDGYDVLCLRNLNLLEEVFIKIRNREKCKIIVGNEIHITHINKFIAQFIFGTCKEKSLNAGTYISYADDLEFILKQIITINNNNDADDQKLLTEYCNLNNDVVYIDDKNEIFLTIIKHLSQINELEFIDDTIKYNNNYPFFIHVPNGLIDDLIIKLNYNYDPTNNIGEQIINNYNKNKSWTIFFDIIKIKLESILLILIILIFIIIIIKKNY